MSFEASKKHQAPEKDILPWPLVESNGKEVSLPQRPRKVLKREDLHTIIIHKKCLYKSMHVLFECNNKEHENRCISASIFAFETHTPGQCRWPPSCRRTRRHLKGRTLTTIRRSDNPRLSEAFHTGWSARPSNRSSPCGKTLNISKRIANHRDSPGV